MKDRYLFRGKRIDNGEWVEGSLICEPWGMTIQYLCIVDGRRCKAKVDSSTICQCTGLKDKNGKLIWENDIVETQYGKAVVVWDKSEWRIKWIDDLIWRKDLHYWANDNSWRIEVVGNKFDNPELLEVQK